MGWVELGLVGLGWFGFFSERFRSNFLCPYPHSKYSISKGFYNRQCCMHFILSFTDLNIIFESSDKI